MFSSSLKKIISRSQEQALKDGFLYYRPEHLLITILEESDKVKEIFNKNNISEKNLIFILLNYLGEQLNKDFDSDKNSFDFSSSYKTVIDRARFQSIARSGKGKNKEIDEFELILAIMTEDTIFAYKALEQVGLKRYMLTDKLNTRTEEENIFEEDMRESESVTSEGIIIDLTEMAKKGKLDKLIGRKEELKRLEHILSRKKKNNPILVGDPGVGKTVIVEGLAQNIVDKKVTKDLWNFKVFSLNVSALIAGTKYRGEFEARIQELINTIKKQKAFLFIDEIHMILGAGSSNNSSDLSNILKPHLTNGDLVCIGATTTTEYRQIFEKNSALSRRFNKIEIESLSEEDSMFVINELIETYQSHHGVKYNKDAIIDSVVLSQRYLTNKNLPDKALDIIDEAGAYVKLNEKEKIVKKEHVEKIISKMTKIPVKNIISENEVGSLKELSSNLNSLIFGQSEAIEKVVDSIIMNKAGIKRKDSPIGSFLFLGSTGVGKTELCKQIAYVMNMELLRFDMSEYMEKHTVSKLIGAPAGYIGYQNGGLLTEKINKNPYSVLLLDEIEKAHPDVLNVLLQIMDYGFITDSEGRKIDCRNILLIMTSNCGVKKHSIEKNSIGFVKEEKISSIDYSIVNQTFTPEFRNRLTEIIEFNSLNDSVMKNIVKKAIAEIQVNLDEKNINLHVTDGVISYLLKEGFDQDMGARPINKIVEKEISKNISKLIIFERLGLGDEIKVKLKNKKIDFTFVKKDIKEAII